MKKNLIFNRNNKGAALISIMITIAFVSIVATTLLMISFNNYSMKVTSAQSKNNFYETELDLNIVTAQVRNAIVASTDAEGAVNSVKAAVGDATDSSIVDSSKLASLVYPGATVSPQSDGSAKVTVENDEFYFNGGTITPTSKTSGYVIKISDVEVKQVSVSGYENTVKTDIEFYVQQSGGASDAGGVGDCSFLLDNSIDFNGSDVSQGINLVNIYGNCIMGYYNLVEETYVNEYASEGDGIALPTSHSKYSKPRQLNNSGGTAVTLTSVADDACLYVRGIANLNFLSDYTLIMGDVFLDDYSVMTINSGSFTIMGNLYIKGKAAFICAGDLKLGPNSHVYIVNDSGALSELALSFEGDTDYLSSTCKNTLKNNNLIVTGKVVKLEKDDQDKLYFKLKLLDEDEDNDGILPNILQPLTKDGVDYYCTDFTTQHDIFTNYSIFGQNYRCKVPEEPMNGNIDHALLFVSNNVSTSLKLQEELPYCTFISENPVNLWLPHNICLTQVGDAQFKQLRSDSAPSFNMQVQRGSSTASFSNKKIKDLFNTNCDTFVSDVFSIANGSDSGTPSISKTAVSYKNWVKE